MPTQPLPVHLLDGPTADLQELGQFPLAHSLRPLHPDVIPLLLLASGSAETDREALVALYNATEGEDWIFSNNWLSDAPLGEWKGVTTNADGRVTRGSIGSYGRNNT